MESCVTWLKSLNDDGDGGGARDPGDGSSDDGSVYFGTVRLGGGGVCNKTAGLNGGNVGDNGG